MKERKHSYIKGIFIFAAFFLLTLSIFCYIRINGLTRSYYWVNHTNLVKLELERLYSNVKGSESAMRGYLLTGDALYLGEFDSSIREIDTKLDILGKLTYDNAGQQRNNKVLRMLVDTRIKNLKDAIKAGAVNKIPYETRVKNRAARKVLKNHIDKMMHEEEVILKSRTKFMMRQSSLTPLFTILLMISAIIALIASYYGITRELKISDQLQRNLEESKKLLLTKNETLLEKNETLAKVNKELEAFTYISSHDLQEPLRKIQTLISVVKEKEMHNLSDSGINYLSRIQDASGRMQSLIKDLLAYSRVKTELFPVKKMLLATIIKDVEEDLYEEINAKNAVIEFSGEAEVSVILTQFRQLLTNLISNSIKFSRQDVPSHIVIENKLVPGSDLLFPNAIPAKYYSNITVSDNGIGFDTQYKERIFEVFQRLHSDPQYAGTGIGLAIVKKIVENHHGFITADTNKKGGAVFNIYLPA